MARRFNGASRAQRDELQDRVKQARGEGTPKRAQIAATQMVNGSYAVIVRIQGKLEPARQEYATADAAIMAANRAKERLEAQGFKVELSTASIKKARL